MNNQTTDTENSSLHHERIVDIEKVDESWALALLNEAMDNNISLDVNSVASDNDVITVRDSSGDRHIVADADLFRPPETDSFHESSDDSAPSAIELQQQAYSQLKMQEERMQAEAARKAKGLLAGWKALFSKS